MHPPAYSYRAKGGVSRKNHGKEPMKHATVHRAWSDKKFRCKQRREGYNPTRYAHGAIGDGQMKRFGILILMAMSAAGICAAQEAKASAPAVVTVRAGQVLDVRTGIYAKDQIIWIEGDKIKSIGNAADIEKQLPAGAKRFDLSRATVLPGLIDCHTHLTGSPFLLGPIGFHTSYPREALLG